MTKKVLFVVFSSLCRSLLTGTGYIMFDSKHITPIILIFLYQKLTLSFSLQLPRTNRMGLPTSVIRL